MSKITKTIDPEKPWLARVTYNPEGIISEKRYATFAEADAFVMGFYAAHEITEQDDDNGLEDYDAHAIHESKDEAVDE